MPEMPVQQRTQGLGARRALDPHNGGPCDCDWTDPSTWTAANLQHRVLPRPDQSRYGPAVDPHSLHGHKWPTNRNGLPRKADEQGRPIT